MFTRQSDSLRMLRVGGRYFTNLVAMVGRQHGYRAAIDVDVASEWSLFPKVVRRLKHAKVYQQDLIYPPGISGNYIGGNAAHMPVADGFADKLVLHNAFEHFAGTADTDFIAEAWRVLKPSGALGILPLFVSQHYSIFTDPLVERAGIVWDDGAQLIEWPGFFNNRFGRSTTFSRASVQSGIVRHIRRELTDQQRRVPEGVWFGRRKVYEASLRTTRRRHPLERLTGNLEKHP